MKLRKQTPGLLFVAGFIFCGSAVVAQPSGEQLISGSADFIRQNQNLSIDQFTDKVIINWQDFSIPADAVTRFNQPSALSAALNRVISGNPSSILGTLEANGQVYLINPNGVLVGTEGVINTQGFIASTLDMQNADFLDDGDFLFSGASENRIINLGSISSQGDVYLIARQVENHGEIVAGESAGVASGTEVLLTMSADESLSVRLGSDNSNILNAGLVAGAKAELKAANNNPYALAINSSGVVRATGAVNENGRIILQSSRGSTSVSGELVSPGGEIRVLGETIDLTGNAFLSTSAPIEAGKILVGGDFQAAPGTQRSFSTAIGSDVIIKADGLGGGDGGTIVVWADDTATVAGTLSANAGLKGGNGGLIETSALNTLEIGGSVEASAPLGENGQWIIDPANLVVDRDMADAIEQSLDNDTDVLVTTFTGFPLLESDTVTNKDSSTLFDSTVNLEEPGNITVEASITKAFGNQDFVNVYSMTTRGDAKVGAKVEDFSVVAANDLVFVSLPGDDLGNRAIVDRTTAETQLSDLADYVISEIPTDGDFLYMLKVLKGTSADDDGNVKNENIQSRTFIHRSEIDQFDTSSGLFLTQEINSDAELVLEKIQNAIAGTNVPTLEFLTPEGDITINAPIISEDGGLNVVLNAGITSFALHRNERVNINADIVTNGGDIQVRAPDTITVADNVVLNTQPDGPGTGESAGDITLLVDKQIGFSSNFLFYRSDVSTINIGNGVSLLADSSTGRDGSIRLLAVANLTDAFEDGGWLGVRNYTDAQINVGNNATIRGGVIDMIADSQTDADVGAIIDILVGEVVESAEDTGLTATVTANNDDDVITPGEDIANAVMDVGTSGSNIHSSITGGDQSVNEPLDFAGASAEFKVPFALLENIPVSDLIADIPFLGDFLTASPIAIAIAESDANVSVGSNTVIAGSDLVTLRANSGADANATSEFPGFALALGYSNANSDVDIASNASVVTTALNRATPTDPALGNEPFVRFKADSPFGLDRDFLKLRNTGSALEIDSIAASGVSLNVAAATLDNDTVNGLLTSSGNSTSGSGSTGGTGGSGGTTGSSGSSSSDRQLDSPVDIALGITIIKNSSNTTISSDALIQAQRGDVNILTQSLNSAASEVLGGSVFKPEAPEEGETEDRADADDIVNAAIAIQYVELDVNSRVDGKVEGQQVDIAALSSVVDNVNAAKSDNGYTETPLKSKTKLKTDSATSSTDSSTDSSSGSSGSSGGLGGSGTNNTSAGLLNMVTAVTSQVQEQSSAVSGSENQDLGIAGAVAIAVNDYEINNTIGSSAEIISNAPALTINANHSSGQIHNSASSGVHLGRKNAVALAVTVGVYSNDVDTVIEDGAVIRAVHPSTPLIPAKDDTTSAIAILASSTIESPYKSQGITPVGLGKGVLNAVKNPKGAASIVTDPLTYGKTHIANLVQNGNLLTTSWANSFTIFGEAPATPGTGSSGGSTTGDTTGGSSGGTTSGSSSASGGSSTSGGLGGSGASGLGTGSAGSTVGTGAGSNVAQQNSDYSADIGVAGSFNLLVMDNQADVTIGDALVTVEGASPSSRNDIEMRAEAWTHSVLVAGTIAPPIATTGGDTTTSDGGDADSDVTSTDGSTSSTNTSGGAIAENSNIGSTSLVDEFIPGDSPGSGIGGAINLNFATNNATLTVNDGAIIETLQGELFADAVSHYETSVLQLSGGKAENVGVNGTFGLNNLVLNGITTIGDGANINAKGVNVTGVTNLPGNIVLSGGFAFSAGVGIGAGIAINNIERNATADLGAVGTGSQAGSGGSLIAENVNVTAASNGFATTVGLAGGVSTGDSEDEEAPGFTGNADTTQTNTTDTGDGNLAKSAAGIGISGSVAVSLATAKTFANVGFSNGNISRTLDIKAEDNVDMIGLAGGAAISLSGGVAVAGAAAINRIESETHALLSDGNNFNGYDLNVNASSIGRITGLSAGLAVVAQDTDPSDGGSSGPEFAVAGSFTYNEIQSDTVAEILNTDISLLGRPTGSAKDDDIEDDEDAIEVIAADGSQIVGLAGAISVSVSADSKAAVGAGVGINTIQGKVAAEINDSTITGAAGSKNVAVAANRIAPIYSFGVAGAVSAAKGSAAAFSIGLNFIDSAEDKGTYAELNNSTITGAGDLTLQSGNESQILAIAGAIAGTGGEAAVGGAFAFNEMGGDSLSEINNSTVNVRGDVGLFSSTHSANSVEDAAIDGDALLADAKKAGQTAASIYVEGVNGVVKAKEAATPPVVAPVDTLDLFGSQAAIHSLAAAGGGSGKVAVFGAGTVNIINNNVGSHVTDSAITAGKDVTLYANNAGTIRSAAGTIAISLGAAAVGGAVNYNTLRGTTGTSVTDSSIRSTGGDVLAGAERSGVIQTLGAGASVASTAGVQGTVSVSTLADTVVSNVLGSDLTGNGEVSVLASENVYTDTAAGGIAGGGTAAVGVSVAVLVSENTTQANVGASASGISELNGGKGVNVKSLATEDHSTVVMTASVAGTAAVAGSVGVKIVNSEASANVGDGTRINQDGSFGDVLISSDSNFGLDGAAGSVGVSGTAGIGAGLDLTVLQGRSLAVVGDNADITGKYIKVDADSNRDISSFTVAAGGGLVGVAGGVSVIHAGGGEQSTEARQALGQESYTDEEGNEQQAGDLQAYVQDFINPEFSNAQITTVSNAAVDGDTVAQVGDSRLNTIFAIDITADGHHDVDVISGALGVGAVGAGAGVASVTYNSDTRAAMLGSEIAAEKVNVLARDQDLNTHTPWFLIDGSGATPSNDFNFTDYDAFSINAVAGGAGAVGIGADVAVVVRDNSTSARLSNNATVNDAGTEDDKVRVNVDAQRDRDTYVSGQGAAAGAGAVGVSVASLHVDGDVVAFIDGEFGTAEAGLGGLSVTANADEFSEVIALAATAGVIAGSGSVANTAGDNASVLVGTGQGTIIHSAGDVLFDASADTGNQTKAQGVQVTVAGVGVGISDSFIGADTTTRVGIGRETQILLPNAGSTRVTLRSRIDTDEDGFFTDTSLRSEALAEASSGGVSVSSVAGASAVTEQDHQAVIEIGEGSVIESVLVNIEADAANLAKSRSVAVAFAAGVGVGNGNAFNRNNTRSSVVVGNNAVIDTAALELSADTLHAPQASVDGVSGSILNANAVQVANTEADYSEALITINDGAILNVTNNFYVNAFNGISPASRVEGTAASGIVTVADFGTTLGVHQSNATVDIGAATLRGTGVLNINADNLVTFNADSHSTAIAVGASAVSTVVTAVNGNASINLGEGSELSAEEVNLTSQYRESELTLASLADGTIISTGSIVNANNQNVAVTVAEEANIYSNTVNILATPPEEPQHEFTALQGLSGNAQGAVVDVSILGQQILFDGSIHQVGEGAGILDISILGRFITVNGRGYESVAPGIAEHSGRGTRIFNLGTGSASNSKVLMNASETGQVSGTGKLINSGGIIREVNISSEGSLVFDGINLTGSGDTPESVLEIVSANDASFDTVSDGEGGRTININGATVSIEGDFVTAPDGNILIQGTDILFDEDAALYSNNISLMTTIPEKFSSNGNIGSETNPANLVFTGDSETPAVTMAAAGEIFANLQLSDSTGGVLAIGDVNSRDATSLNLLARLDGSASIFDMQGEMSSLGSISLLSEAANDSLFINGTIRSGALGDTDDTVVEIIINGFEDLTSNLPGLTSVFTESSEAGAIAQDVLSLANVAIEGSGVNIRAATLGGNGLIENNTSGFDLVLTNNFDDLDALSISEIDLLGVQSGVTYNDELILAGSTIGDIRVGTFGSSTGKNNITINDDVNAIDQIVIFGDLFASGGLTVNSDSLILFTQSELGSGVQPRFIADGITLNTPSLRIMSGAGPNGEFLLDVGEGGLSAIAESRISVRDVAGDFKINRLEVTNGVEDTSTLNVSAEGNIIGDENTAIFANGIAQFSAGGDILLGESDNILILGRLFKLEGKNVAFANQADLTVFLSESYDSLHLKTGGARLTGFGAVTVSGETRLEGGNAITLNQANNDFQGPVSILPDNSTIYDTTRLIDIADINDIMLDEVDVGFGLDASAGIAQNFIVNAGSISETETGSVAIRDKFIVNGGGDVVLPNLTNQISGQLFITGDNIRLGSESTIQLGDINAKGELWVNSSQQILGVDGTRITVGQGSELIAPLISLAGGGNDFGDTLSAAASILEFTDINGVSLDGVNVSQILTANISSGDLTDGENGLSANQLELFIPDGDAILDSSNNDIDFITRLTVNNLTVVDNGDSLSIFNPVVNLNGDLNLEANNLSFNTTQPIRADNLRLVSRTGDILSTSGIVTEGDATFEARVITLDSVGIGGVLNLKGEFVQASNNSAVSGDLTLGEVDVEGALLLSVSQGSLFGTAPVKAGTAELIVRHDIELTNPDNDFDNFKPLSLTGGDITVVDANAITLGFSLPSFDRTLGSFPVGNVDVTAGSIGFRGRSNITGNAVFKTTSGSISFNQGDISIAGDTIIDSAANIRMLGDNFEFASISSITAGRDLDVRLINTTNGSSNGPFVAGILNIGRNASIEASDITLDSLSVGGNLYLDAWESPGGLNIDGAISVGGESTLLSYKDIVLDNPDNMFAGAVSVKDRNSSRSATSLDVTLANKGELILGNFTLKGGLIAEADSIQFNGAGFMDSLRLNATAGDIKGAPSVNIVGASRLTAEGDIELAGTAEYRDGIRLKGNNISLSASGKLTVNDVDAAGDLSLGSDDLLIPYSGTVQSGGKVSLTGNDSIIAEAVLTLAGDLEIAGADSLLSNRKNNIAGTITATGGSLALTNSGDLNLGQLDLDENLVLRSATGDIALDSATLRIGGETDIFANEASISLSNPDNVFTGPVNITGAEISIASEDLQIGSLRAISGDIRIESSNDLLVEGLIETPATLFLVSDGNIRTADPRVSAGTFNIMAGGDIDVVMKSDGLISAAGNHIAIVNKGPTNLGNITATDGLNVSTTGFRDALINGDQKLDITGSTVLTSVSSSIVNAGADIVLSNPENIFNGPISVNANEATLRTTGDMFLDSIEVRKLDLQSFAGNILTDENSRFELDLFELKAVAARDINFHNLALGRGEQFLSAQDITLEIGGTTNLGNIFAGGDLTINDQSENGGLIYNGETSAIIVSGVTRINRSAIITDENNQLEISLKGRGNDFQGPVNIDASQIELNASGSIQLGNVNAGGDRVLSESFKPGKLMITSTGGDITAPGIIRAADLELTVREGGNISLPNPLNDFSLPVLTVPVNDDVQSLIDDGGRIKVAGVSTSEITSGASGEFGLGNNRPVITVTPTDAGNVLIRSSGAMQMSGQQVSGNLELHSGGRLSVDNLSAANDMLLVSDSELFINGELAAGADVMLAANDTVTNTTSSLPVSAGNRWLIYSTRPDYNTGLNISDADFLAYGEVLNPADPGFSTRPLGNGMVFSVVPFLEGLSLTPLDQTIAYGEAINEDFASATAGGFSGAATGRILVDGEAISPAVFGIDLSAPGYTRDAIGLGYNESVVSRSTGGFVNAGSYESGIIAKIKSDAEVLVTGIAVAGGANLRVLPKVITTSGIKALDREYDGTANVEIQLDAPAGILDGDDTFVEFVLGEFSDKNAGVDKAVNILDVVFAGADLDNYVVADSVLAEPVSATILPKLLDITLLGQSKEYDGTAGIELDDGDFLSDGFVNGEAADIVGRGLFNSRNVQDANRVTVNLGGSNFVNASGGFLAGNYQLPAELVNTNSVITPAPLTIDVTQVRKVYDGLTTGAVSNDVFVISGLIGDEEVEIKATARWNSRNVKEAESATIRLGESTFINADNGFILSNYSFANELKTDNAMITPAVLRVVVNNATIEADGTPLTEFSYSSIGLKAGDTLADIDGTPVFSGTALNATAPGEYSASISGLHADNYRVLFVNGTITLIDPVTGAVLTITADDITKVYDGTAFAGPVTFTASGFKPGDNASVINGVLGFTGTAVGATNAGSYTITPEGLSADGYTINYITGNLNINPADLTVTANDLNLTYDASAYAGGNGVIYTGFVGAEDDTVLAGALTFGGTSQGAINAGTYSIAPTGQLSTNYNINYVDGALTIDPAQLTVTASDLTKTYDSVAFVGGNGAVITGFVGGETIGDLGGALSFTGTSQNAADAGTYVITPGGLTSSNYLFTNVDGVLTINQAALGVALNSIFKFQDGNTAVNTFSLAGDYTINGFVGAESADISEVGNFDNASPGINKTVTVDLDNASFINGLNGFDPDNYSFPAQVVNTTSVIDFGQQQQGP